MTSIKKKEDWEKAQRTIGSFDKRKIHNQKLGWFILTQEVMDKLALFMKNKTVVEVFAGTGYLANAIRKRAGMDEKQYRAYDNASYSRFYEESRHSGVTYKNAFMAPIKKAGIVVMTWPPYATNHGERIVKKMCSGQYLVFNGEGRGGCTGNDKMFECLKKDFDHLQDLSECINAHHVRFFGIHDHWEIYRKR